MSLYVAAYDIGDDNRRTRASRVLLEYGRRVQQSVFELLLEPKQIRGLRRRLAPILAPEDRFDLFPVDERGPRRRIGWRRAPHPYCGVTVIVPAVEGGEPAPGAKIFRREQIRGLERCNPPARRVSYFQAMAHKPEPDRNLTGDAKPATPPE